MFFRYPYTDLYALNLDWIIGKISELESITELGNIVVALSDGEHITDYTQSQLSALYETGTRLVIEDITNIKATTLSFLIENDAETIDVYVYAGGVSSVNGSTGDVILTGDDIGVSTDDSTTIANAITTITQSITSLIQGVNSKLQAVRYNNHAIQSTYNGSDFLNSILVADTVGDNDNLVSNEAVYAADQHLQTQITALDDKVNPEAPTTGYVLTIDANGESVWAPASGGGGTGTLTLTMDTVTKTVTPNTPTAVTMTVSGETLELDVTAGTALTATTESVVKNAVLS